MAETRFSRKVEAYFFGYETKVFHTGKAVLRWAKEEREFWQNLDKTLGRDPTIPGVAITDFIAFLKDIEHRANQFLTQQNESSRLQIEDHLRDQLQVYADRENSRYIPSDAEEAHTINALATSNPIAAWIAIGRYRGTRLPAEKIPDLQIFLENWHIVFARGFDATKAVKAHGRALERLKDEWGLQFEETRDGLLQLKVQNEHWSRRLRNVAVRLMKSYRQARVNHQERMQKMEREFSTDMQLRAAEKFWAKKRRLNRQREHAAFNKLAWVGAAGLPVLGLIYFCVYKLFGTTEGLSLSHTIIYGVPTLAYVWLLRIFATEHRTNRTMADDAEEREAMVMTFKALEHEERVGKDERLLILNALFRPSDSSAEESIPMPAWESMIGKSTNPK